jgi:hypothetical protein
MIEKKQSTWGGFARWVADNYSTLGLDLEERERSKDRLVAASRYVDTERAAFGAIVAAGYAESGAQRLRDLWLSYTSSRGIAAPGADRGSILGPPDLGRLRPAEEAARSIVRDPVENALGMWEFWISGGADDDDNFVVEDYSSKEGAEFDVGVVRGIIARVYDRGRTDGAAEAMRAVAEAADAFDAWATEQATKAEDSAPHEAAESLYTGKAEAFRTAAATLRSLHPASTRGFIEPPDMGRPNALSETTSEIRGRIALQPGADRGFIQPPDLGKPGNVGFIEPPDMGRGK